MLAKNTLLILLPFYIAAVNAANDWSKPCTNGWCEWDIKDGDASGNIIVTAATSALSDITAAAGWHILDCDANSLDPQVIRLVCESEDADAAGCSAIYEGGVENTVVRLPNSCGGGPFARLVRTWESPDQSIPEEARRKFRKRQENPGTVQNAIIDFNFAEVPPENEVNIQATGSNNPAAPASQQAAQIRRAYISQKMRRGLSSRGFFSDFFDFLSDLNKVEVSKDGSSEAKFQQNFPIASGSTSCPATATTPAFDAGFNINVDVDVSARVSYGFVVEGKIVPPTISDVGLYAALTGGASAVFRIDASAKATLDSGRIEVANIPLSPLSIPGIVNIGPSASLGVSGLAELGITGKIDVGAHLNLPKVEMRFPPKHGASSGDSQSTQSPLKLEVKPEVDVGGALEAHIIPRVALGVDLIGGFAKANVFLDLDVKGRAALDFKATAEASTETDPNAAVSGCLDVDAGIAVRAGAEGSVAGIFDANTSVDIFNKNFDLFTKCFGVGTQAVSARSLESPIIAKRGLNLLCPGTVSAVTTLVDQLVG